MTETEDERATVSQSDERWNRCKGKVTGTSERRGGAHNKSFSERIDTIIVQELCVSRGGRPGLSVLTSHLISVDVKQY